MYLGLDLGTTNVKALLIDERGTVQSRGSVEVGLGHTSEGGVEQDLEEIWAATLEAAWRAAGTGGASVKAVGISSQGAALQLRDRQGRCLGPVISWMDPRGAAEDRELVRVFGSRWLAEHIGHGQAGLSLGHLMRLRRTQPEMLDQAGVIGFVGDAIVERLCGRAAHDASSLSIACLYNPMLDAPEPAILRHLGISRGQLPALLPARQPAGALGGEAARRMGVPAGIPVGPAIHDQYAAAVGSGTLEAGDVMFGCGTAWVLVAVAEAFAGPVVPSAWVCRHVVPQRWGQLLSLVVGGSAFRWALEMTGLADAGREAIDDLMAAVPPGSDGLRVWPFHDATGGARRPTAGRIEGLRLAHGRGHLLRATLEGLCFELARQLGWLARAGFPARRLIMCGGAARSRLTPQIVADTTGCAVVCPREPEISAFGAAVLARAMLEPQQSIPELHAAMAGPRTQILPGPASSGYRGAAGEYARAVDAAAADQGGSDWTDTGSA